jgi:acyl-CoA reductase-like NAD-dependent aldehyde dehydrogenase
MAQRLTVNKTYKLFIGGKFPRSESGHTAMVMSKNGRPLAAYCKASRKDLRDAVALASGGQAKWSSQSPYLRGQILYRAAEMLEGGAAQVASALQWHGMSPLPARRAVEAAVDTLVHFAGWTDKFQQLSSSVNPVASPHFVFTVPEPCGVVAQIHADRDFEGLVSGMARLLCGGNACISIVGERLAIAASILGEIWHTSDLPAGAMAILTGEVRELAMAAATHRAVDGILGQSLDPEVEKQVQEAAADTVKRLSFQSGGRTDPLEAVLAFQDLKTTWHPVGW